MTTVAPILITGAAGFSGSHLVDLLQSEGIPLVAWRRPGGSPPHTSGELVIWADVDLLDAAGVQRAVADTRPAIIYHCAGAPHVGSSWGRTYPTLARNVLGTSHLIEAVRREGLAPRILIPGSALVYQQSQVALTEDHAVGPASPYALSKLAQEMLGLRAFHDDGLPVLLTRSFNHFGPRQDPAFSAAGFARQIALIEAGAAEPVVEVGNLDARRDLTDVRDTVRAYRLVAERGRPGVMYNVCAGQAHRIGDVLDRLVALAQVRVTVRADPGRYRPQDNPLLLGDNRRIRDELGWAPAIPLDRTLADLLDYWRGEVRGGRRGA